ncbi:MAG: hypothetical protein Q9224_006442 [Gallowayella concinna]
MNEQKDWVRQVWDIPAVGTAGWGRNMTLENTTLNQLIALRVFQGIGGSGLYSMIMVVGPEITPTKYWGALSGVIGLTLAIGSVLGNLDPISMSDTAHTPAVGPILGGVITEQVDWLGATLLLAASALLVFGLQQGGSTTYKWNSATIITTLVISGTCWVSFFIWTSWLARAKVHQVRAIFPINIALTRPLGPSIIFLGGAVSSKKNFTSPTLIIAACLILIGCGLLSTLDGGKDIYSPTYAYQFILGLGVGLTFSSSTLLASLASKPEDVAAAQGALSQARILGGSIGLAMATVVLNNRISDNLAGVVDPLGIKSIQQSVNSIVALSPTNQALVSRAYSDAFNEQMRICAYLSAAGFLISLATYQKTPPSVAAMREKQNVRVESRISQASTQPDPAIEPKRDVDESK